MKTSAIKRLGFAVIVLCLAAAACSGGSGEATTDHVASSCSKYIKAYDGHDQVQVEASVNEIITIARASQDPNNTEPALAPMVAATVLAAGPLPWQTSQYGLLRQACVAYLAS